MPHLFSTEEIIIKLIYLVAASCFIVGIKWMNHPTTARKGNILSGIGMAIAFVLAVIGVAMHGDHGVAAEAPSAGLRWGVMLSSLFIGTAVGWVMATRVQMTDMPQLVAIFNGMGGGAVAAVSTAGYLNRVWYGSEHEALWSILLGMIIGSVSFSGSWIAFGKLQGLISGRPITFAGQRTVNMILLIATVALGVYVFMGHLDLWPYLLALVLANLFGVLLVLPVGGADMPVVISLLNSFTGTSACIAGFSLSNEVLIIGGALVGASGFILTTLMCKAMNRSLFNVMFGTIGSAGVKAASTAVEAGGSITETGPEDCAIMLAYANRVIIVPGYGLAVAQAQHAVQELAELLEKKGVEVKYAIHPVAGRMPGHMNVLLAEANVPYNLLVDMEDINPEFEKTDVALIIGANDVTNPSARHDTASPIYGMPILDVDKARNIVVMKRSMGAGYAGIDNPLYLDPKCKMFFGDAKKSLLALISEVQNA